MLQNVGDQSGDGPRLHDYKAMGELAAAMPTVKEKVDFVSPYERPWKRFERTWHRSVIACLIAVSVQESWFQFHSNIAITTVVIAVIRCVIVDQL